MTLLGVQSMPLWGELDNLGQGSDRLNIPCGWWKDDQYNNGWCWVFFLCAPTVAHSFTFFTNNEAATLGTVTVAAAAQWGSTAFSLPSGGLQGLGDYISVRHNTNAQHSGESTMHTDEGNRVFAGIYPIKDF